jgi:hypothetical protein
VTSIRVTLCGDPELLRACAPGSGGGSVEYETSRGAEPVDTRADVVIALGSPPRGAPDAPVITWVDGGAPLTPPSDHDRVIGPWLGAWRSLVLPVADSLFGSAPDGPAGTAAWLGDLGARRAEYEALFTHSVELVETQPAEAPPAPVALNLHENGAPAFEHRAAVALAAGCVLVSETLAPAHGLEPGLDYLEGRTLDDLYLGVETAAGAPSAFRRMRLRGRAKAERFRASTLLERVARDLLLELTTNRKGTAFMPPRDPDGSHRARLDVLDGY